MSRKSAGAFVLDRFARPVVGNHSSSILIAIAPASLKKAPPKRQPHRHLDRLFKVFLRLSGIPCCGHK
jgi:hypothetical protein